MTYWTTLDQFPLIRQFYSVTRNTTWQIADADHILIFIKEGSCQVNMDHEEWILQPGDVCFIPRNHAYTRTSTNGTLCTMSYIHFSLDGTFEQISSDSLTSKFTELRAALDNQILNGAPLLTHLDHLYIRNKASFSLDSPIFQLLNGIQLFSTKRQLMCGLQSSINLCGILSLLSQDTIDSVSRDIALGQQEIIPDNLRKAIRYIRKHYAENIKLDDLAAYCNISKQQLTRYFQAAFQITPIAYVTNYRIAKAKDLLFNHPQLTITEISDELGFNNPHYFSTVFRNVTGESPRDYRKRTIISDPNQLQK